MRRFLSKSFRFFLIGLIPFIIICILYVVLDPFKVVHHYNAYVETGSTGMVTMNKDYVSTQTFINNNSKEHYNSFILGNSRSMFYQVADWKKHLAPDASCYHFDASGETLWAINKKLEYIDKTGNKIDNLLLVVDNSVLMEDKPKSGHLFVISPKLVNDSNIVDFHMTFFKAFLTPKFLYAFLDFKVSNRVKPYMRKEYLLDDRQRNYDAKTNEERFEYFENQMAKGEYYTPKRMEAFFQRDTTVQKFSPECLHDSQKSILANMQAILIKHNTRLRLVISPAYDQIKLNANDLVYLKNLFGENNVFDFSGINQFTGNYQNYYEASHYRPHVARQLMEMMYAGQ